MRSKVGRFRLRYLRNRRGWTQAELARHTCIAESLVSEYETNERRMMLGTARTFALALGCTFEDLYEWVDD